MVAPKNESTLITVQRLSSSVEGKWQKYARIGPLTMVHLGCEATRENIKKECKKHFNITDMDCDILDGERGPSFTDILASYSFCCKVERELQWIRSHQVKPRKMSTNVNIQSTRTFKGTCFCAIELLTKY